MTVNELRAKRAELWEQTKDFLEKHRDANTGLVNAEDTATYDKMMADIDAYAAEIKRLEDQAAVEMQMAQASREPIHGAPAANDRQARNANPLATDEYRNAFWSSFRSRTGSVDRGVYDALQVGTASEGGYLVPDEFERQLIQGLDEENVIRSLAHVITTSNGIHKIPVVTTKGTASWIEEEGAYTESDNAFGQVNLDAHKLGTLIKVSEELLQDSAFNLEGYIASEFNRRMGDKEEEAFISGNGSHKPTGILDATNGGTVAGITTAKNNDIAADELFDLFYALKAPYRKRAHWVFNDSTIKVLRKLKTSEGQYIWQPGIKDGEVDTLLGRPYHTSAYMPAVASTAKAIIFGDLSYYWIGDRQGITFKRLNELYAGTGQVGFLATRRLDAKVVLKEAIQILQMKA